MNASQLSQNSIPEYYKPTVSALIWRIITVVKVADVTQTDGHHTALKLC
jgi:hypothetical protein